MSRNGGQILVDQLRIQGAEAVFSVPGESFLSVLDSLYELQGEIRLVVARHEGGAANMADAHAKLTGKPGICLVNRGPGATQAAVGVHTAFQDSTPMLVLVGQGPLGFLGRESFQEIDHRIFFSELTKWSGQIDRVERIPEMIRRAYQIALQGRPGPVALSLPEDVLAATADVSDAAPHVVTRPHPSDADIALVFEMLESARRPLVIVGGGGWTADTSRLLRAFVETNQLPVVASFRCQDYLDNDSPSYIGYAGLAVHPVVAGAFQTADLVIAVGARLGEASTARYTLIDVHDQRQKLIHVHLGPEELGAVYRADLPINSGYEAFAGALAGHSPVDSSAWRDWADTLRSEYLDQLDPVEAPGDLNLASVVRHVSDRVPRDAIVTNGAGNFTVWAHRYHQFHEYRTQLGPTSGSMGYGVPAAVAAKIAAPDRVVICWTGDGDASMSIMELAVAMQHGLDPIILLVDNGMLATMRMHQERHYPGRVFGSELVNPDFVQLARSFGAHAELVERTEDFADAFERCLDADVASLLDLRLDPEQVTPTTTMSGERSDAEARKHSS
ncbi:MAG: thiamine pyrophosphate-binding protein [Acidimicrobiia bacterium]